MAKRTVFSSPFNVPPNRVDVLRFGPFILAALWRDGVFVGRSISIHRVIAVLEDAGHDLASTEWGELCAIVREATALAELRPRDWNSRALGLLIPAARGMPTMFPVAALAVADEPLSQLVMRLDIWQRPENLNA